LKGEVGLLVLAQIGWGSSDYFLKNVTPTPIPFHEEEICTCANLNDFARQRGDCDCFRFLL